MSKLRVTIMHNSLIHYIAESDEYEVFTILKDFVRGNFVLSRDALLDLVDTDTHDNFVWFFEQYLQDYQIEFELVKGH